METTTIVIIVILVVAAVVLAVALTNYFTEKNATPAPAPVPESNDGYYLNQDGLVNKRAFLRNILVEQNLSDDTGNYYNMTMVASGFVWMDASNKLAYIKYDGVDYYLAADTYTETFDVITGADRAKIYDMTTTSPGVDTDVLYAPDGEEKGGEGLYMVSLYKNPVDGAVAIVTYKINRFVIYKAATGIISRDIESTNPYKWKSGIIQFFKNEKYSVLPNEEFTPNTENSSYWCSTFMTPMPNPLDNTALPCGAFVLKFTGETDSYYVDVDLSDNNDIKISYTQQDIPAELVFNGTVGGNAVEFPSVPLNDTNQSITSSSGTGYTLIGASYIYLSSTSVLDNIEYTPSGTATTTLYWNNVAAVDGVDMNEADQFTKTYTFDSTSPTSNTIDYNGEGLYLVGVLKVTGSTSPELYVMSFKITQWGVIGAARNGDGDYSGWAPPDTAMTQVSPYNYSVVQELFNIPPPPPDTNKFKFRTNNSWSESGGPALAGYLGFPGGDLTFTDTSGDYTIELNVQNINSISYTLTPYVP
jgi:hypothetical protein